MANYQKFANAARTTLAADLTPTASAQIANGLIDVVRGRLSAYIDRASATLGRLVLPYGLKVTGTATFTGNIVATGGSLTAVQPQVTISGDGAITIASSSVFLTKGSAAAITLAAPTSGAPGTGQDGTRITVIAGSSFAHVITATSLVEDGATGVPHTTITFAAFKGASVTLEAQTGLWYVVANNHVTVS